MGLRVNTNVEALSIHGNLIQTNNRVAQSLKRLSSGHRIMSAKDDAAGLAVSNFFKARISSLRVAYQNATESNAMLQVAEGGYSKIHDLLVRMKDLATQAAGGQIDNANRDQLDAEFQQLVEEIDRIAESTQYGGVPLIYEDGAAAGATMDPITFQIGPTDADYDQIEVTLNVVSTTALSVDGLEISTADTALDAMAPLDEAMASLNTMMANLGAYQNRLEHTMENINTMVENFSAAESAIRDVDMAYEVTVYTKNQILQQTGMAMLAQANMAPQQILQLLGG